MREPSAYWIEWAERLDRFGVEARLIGGVAASFYRAEPRSTTDVDFLVRSLDGVADRVRAEGFPVREMRPPGGDPYLLLIRGDDDRVDLIGAETEYQDVVLDRATGPAITVEDVIVHKLLAWRPRDQNDIASIFAARHDLDTAYIEHWAAEWEVSDRWAEAQRLWGRAPT